MRLKMMPTTHTAMCVRREGDMRAPRVVSPSISPSSTPLKLSSSPMAGTAASTTRLSSIVPMVGAAANISVSSRAEASISWKYCSISLMNAGKRMPSFQVASILIPGWATIISNTTRAYTLPLPTACRRSHSAGRRLQHHTASRAGTTNTSNDCTSCAILSAITD